MLVGARSALILMYHHIAEPRGPIGPLSVRLEHLRRHLAVLQDRASVVPLLDIPRLVQRSDSGAVPVAITFDDGYDSAHEEVAQELVRRHLPATFFIVGDTLSGSREFWWDTIDRAFDRTSSASPLVLRGPGAPQLLPVASGSDRYDAHQRVRGLCLQSPAAERAEIVQSVVDWSGISREPAAALPMRPDAVLALAAQPGLTIGSHSQHHLWLPLMTADVQRTEVAESRQRLEAFLSRPVRSFAYPYGAHDADTRRTVGESGYDVAVTASAGGVSADHHPLALPRVEVPDCDESAFRALLDRVLGGASPGPP